MTAEEYLLGFDGRVWGPDHVPKWLAERRDLYLLRRDAAQPLSTDRMVWPCPAELENVQLPGQQPALRLAADLEGAERWLGASTGVLIAVTVLLEYWPMNDPIGWQGWQFGLPADPMPAPPADWHLLGLDIADPWLLSGLSNCGYTPDEQAALAQRFGPYLNDHHLFTDAAQAEAFRHITDARVPEHAPFAVFGLYLIDAS